MFEKQSMINRLSNPINRNRSAAKISKVMSSSTFPIYIFTLIAMVQFFPGVPLDMPFEG